MDLDVLFKQRKPGQHYDRGYSGHQNVHHDHHGGIQQYIYFFKKLKSNKKLLIALSVAAVVILILVIAVLIMIIPPIIKGLDIIQTSWLSGLEGLIKAARPLLELLWSVTGK
jgi:uncharacterized membrane protein